MNVIGEDEGVRRCQHDHDRVALRPERVFFFSSRRRHTRFKCDWSSDVCSSDLASSSPASLAASQADLISLAHEAGDDEAEAILAFQIALVEDDNLTAPAFTSIAEIGRASCRERV